MIISSWMWYLVFLIVFFISLASEIISENFMNSDSFYQENHIPFAISLIISSAIILPLWKRLNTEKVKIYIEKDTWKEVSESHTFFFIKMEYCWYALFIIWVFLCIQEYYIK